MLCACWNDDYIMSGYFLLLACYCSETLSAGENKDLIDSVNLSEKLEASNKRTMVDLPYLVANVASNGNFHTHKL